MTEGSLSRRYGKALFELARDEKREEAVGQEIEQFLTAYQGSALQSVLNNPGFELEQRKRILEQVAKSIQVSPLALHFLSLLFDRDRLPYLQGISSHYRRLLNESRGRVEAKLVAATPLEPSALEQLRNALKGVSGKDVLLQQQTRPELIGGLLVELEGTIYDGSVQTQLDKMKQQIARGY